MDFELIVDGVTAVDEVNRTLARRIVEVVESQQSQGDGSSLSTRQLRRVMRAVDIELGKAYGPTRSAVRRRPMYRAVVREMAVANDEVVRMFFRDLSRALSAVDPTSWDRIVAEFERLGTNDRLATLYLSTHGPIAQQERFRRASLIDPNRRWVRGSNLRLSDRVWKARSTIRAKITRTLREGIRHGDSPVTIARALEQYLNPDYAPVRYMRDGRMIRVSRSHPSAASLTRRLVRTELSYVAAESTVQVVASLDIVGAGVQYSLSPSHPKIDRCDDRAAGSSHGMPRGVYTPADFPRIPQHPSCICFARPWMPSASEVLRQLEERYLA